ncbi:MAG: ChbG/HpnK family deacetylase [Eubacteriales bacterium]|nr:ChbG/HpnK family deacetylase [Eubacteriales bacterium]
MEPATSVPGRDVQIEFHADDYALFPGQTRRILGCYCNGCLNGVSVMPNSKYLEPCMRALPEDVAVTVHLNLIEGKSLTGHPLLSDKRGNLSCSFGALLLRSCLPGQGALRRALAEELRAQIRAVSACLTPGKPLRLDSHAHYHMLPLVFDAMMDVVREDKLDISYIRMPEEHVGLYLHHLGEIRDFSPINLVKVAILNLLVQRNRRKYRTFLDKLDKKLFLGVFLSGRMYRENVEPVLPDALNLARKKGWDIELLAHPGGVLELEDVMRITNKSDMDFLCDDLRTREASLFEL